ncbi:MAG: hypothetical protein ACYDCC_06390 [Actinomycetota bacterium]
MNNKQPFMRLFDGQYLEWNSILVVADKDQSINAFSSGYSKPDHTVIDHKANTVL